ncbi:HindIII family type II restriction endonuclease [Stenotrophomonas muris]|uniref:HindIII family type II restriction endonuclease n=1 Tax=Stenotrophomonas muris TaxID=2963283 RepID=UPI002E78B958|nr:HindIII family type II restriction endonuclease [Stenotrophomonas muris]
MAGKFITDGALTRRAYWINEIVTLSGSFGADATRAEQELNAEYARDGEQCLLDHLRLCGTIPETYGHDSSEEKLYSKYTDALLALAFRHMGLTSTVLTERADSADVDCVAEGYSFVADAKAFRMSRTAKNQKDFKVEAMAGWKRDKPHATVVCPVYHLPTRSSQIYEQAGARGVAILTYSHLAVMCRYATAAGKDKAVALLFNVFTAVEGMDPSQSAAEYWKIVNAAMQDTCGSIAALWKDELAATAESVEASRQEALALLAPARVKIEAMDREQAIAALLASHNIPGREAQVKKIAGNKLLEL